MELSKNRLYLATFVIALGFLLTQLSGSLLPPVLPEATKVFNADASAVKYFVSIFFAGYAVGQMVWGTLSDDFGRRRMARIATITYLFFVLLVIVWKHILFFYINYAFVGFAAANYTSVGNAMLKDLYAPQQLPKIIAMIGVVMGIGPMCGALIGTNLVAYFNWDALFIFLATLAIIILLGMFLVVPETQHPVKQKDIMSFREKAKIVLLNKRFQRSILMLSFSFGAFTSYLTTGSFLFTRVLHFSAYHAGLLMALPALSYVIGAVLVMFVIKGRDPWVMLKPCSFSFLFTAIFLLLLTVMHVPNAYLYVFSLVLCMLVLGMMVPLGKAGCMTAMHAHGGITASLMKLIQSATTVVLSFIIAKLSSSSFMPLSVLYIGVAVVISMVAVSFGKQ